MKILRDNGFKIVNRGRHIKLKKKDSSGRVWTTFISHPHYKEIPVGVLQSIIRQSGKSREEFC